MNDEANSKLILNDGESVKHESHRMKGTLQETDIDTYVILSAAGEKIGSAVHTDHTAIRGFTRTQTIKQYDNSGKLIVDVSW